MSIAFRSQFNPVSVPVSTPGKLPRRLKGRMHTVWRTAREWIPAFALSLLLFTIVRVLGVSLFVVTTDSMEPTLHPRDYVITVDPRWKAPDVGQVVVFAPVFSDSPLPLHVHRIVAHYPDGTWQTRGDAATSADPWRVSTDDVVGVSTGGVLPAALVTNPLTIGLGVFLAAVLLLWPSRRDAKP